MLPRPRSFCAAICPANGPGVSSSSHTPPPPARLTLRPPSLPRPRSSAGDAAHFISAAPRAPAATTRPGQCCRIARSAAPHAHSDEQHESHYQNGLVPVCVEPGPWPLNFLSPQRWGRLPQQLRGRCAHAPSHAPLSFAPRADCCARASLLSWPPACRLPPFAARCDVTVCHV